MQIAIAIVGGIDMLALLVAGLTISDTGKTISMFLSALLTIALFVLALVK